jgi:reductive dehalogenase
MKEVLTFVAGIVLTVQALAGLSFFISCLREREKRASIFAGLQLTAMLLIIILFLYLRSTGFFRTALGAALLALALLTAAIGFFFLFRRSAPNLSALKGSKGQIIGEVKRVDEREIVFARNRSIRPGSTEYEVFYNEHPELESYDAKRRERGGPLGQLGSIDRAGEGPNVAATMACISIPMYLSEPKQVKPSPHPVVKDRKITLTPEEATEKVKGFALHLGADLVGITEINPLWLYSRRGEIFHDNWEDWGREIPVDHQYAVVFATEMNLRLVDAAPHTPTVIESMRNYAKGAYLSIQLASYITNLGYPATANHLRHYEAVLVPLAVDAGLGELGRLGYLMTKKFGPRIRLGAVTTNLPLIPDKPVDLGIKDFCGTCKKCAVCCPSQSIPMGEQAEVNGTLRWRLNAETCFDYWGKVGTDCNICMRVCPWAHARTFPHRIILEFVSRNRLARRIFSVMDDIFYGRKPKSKEPPEWANTGDRDLF